MSTHGTPTPLVIFHSVQKSLMVCVSVSYVVLEKGSAKKLNLAKSSGVQVHPFAPACGRPC